MNNLLTEQWCPIVGFDGYDVSDLGRVRSWRCPGKTVPRSKPWIIAGAIDKDGYRRIVLRNNDRQTQRNFKVSTLVAIAFIGPKPPGKEVAHDNENPSDDRLCNLLYKTPSENCADKLRHGTDTSGERHPMAKLTNSQARQIRITPGTSRIVGAIFGVSGSVIRNIRNGRTYRYA